MRAEDVTDTSTWHCRRQAVIKCMSFTSRACSVPLVQVNMHCRVISKPRSKTLTTNS